MSNKIKRSKWFFFLFFEHGIFKLTDEIVEFQPSLCGWLINIKSPFMETAMNRSMNQIFDISPCTKSAFDTILLIILEKCVPFHARIIEK